MSAVNACHGALGGPFFDNCLASIWDSIVESFWVSFGLVLGSFWHPFGSTHRVKLGKNSILKQSCIEKVDVHEALEKRCKNQHFEVGAWGGFGQKNLKNGSGEGTQIQCDF